MHLPLQWQIPSIVKTLESMTDTVIYLENYFVIRKRYVFICKINGKNTQNFCAIVLFEN